MAKRLIQTIEGATENTVIYEDEAGDIKAEARPKLISVDAILAELGFETQGKKPRKAETKTAEPEEKPAEPVKTPENASNLRSDVPKGADSKNTQTAQGGIQRGK